MNKKIFKKILIVILCLSALLLISFLLVPVIRSFGDTTSLKTFVERFGVFGIVVILLLQLLQIIVAFIPGEVVEFVAGCLFGAIGGTILCTAGIVLGEFLIFKAVKTFGKGFVQKVAGSKKLERFKFLQNETKLKRLTFILYFIPGTPKDLLTYIMALTKIDIYDFLVISSLARLPSVVSSAIAGSYFADKDYFKLAVIYIAVALVSIIGVLVWKNLEGKYVRKHKNNSQQ